MQQLNDVRSRMSSVTGIGEVCRTLSTVAAAKLATARERALGVRDYSGELRRMAARQQRAARRAGIEPETLSPLMESRPVSRVLVVVIGADRGLCGGYNLALGREAKRFLGVLHDRAGEVETLVIGHRAERYLQRACGIVPDDVWPWTRAGVTEEMVADLLELTVEAFTSRRVDEVWAVYTSFVSAIQRYPRLARLLPIAALGGTEDDVDPVRWFYEPSRGLCVAEILEVLVRLQIEDVLLETYASEQAARMVTMQEASERADKSLEELRIRYNRLRREAITADLTGVLVAGRVRQVANDA